MREGIGMSIGADKQGGSLLLKRSASAVGLDDFQQFVGDDSAAALLFIRFMSKLGGQEDAHEGAAVAMLVDDPNPNPTLTLTLTKAMLVAEQGGASSSKLGLGLGLEQGGASSSSNGSNGNISRGIKGSGNGSGNGSSNGSISGGSNKHARAERTHWSDQSSEPFTSIDSDVKSETHTPLFDEVRSRSTSEAGSRGSLGETRSSSISSRSTSIVDGLPVGSPGEVLARVRKDSSADSQSPLGLMVEDFEVVVLHSASAAEASKASLGVFGSMAGSGGGSGR